jgi:hypothetical protein
MNDQHILKSFDRDLEAIQAQILKMGGLVEEAILQGGEALASRDVELADRVRKGDKAIDALEEHLNEEVARTIALRAPVSRDLRILLSVLRLAASPRAGGRLRQEHRQARHGARRKPRHRGRRRLPPPHGARGAGDAARHARRLCAPRRRLGRRRGRPRRGRGPDVQRRCSARSSPS